YDEKALDFVTRRFADDKGVEVTLFNGYTPVPKIELRNSLIMEKISSNLAYLQQKIYEHETGIKQAREKLIQNGFSSNRIHYIFRALNKDVAHDIVDLVLDKGFDVVVLNRNPGKITRFFTGSISNKVMKSLKKVDVYVVT
ncbi:MAG: universal stress protein, partial [Desulfobacterales bacterium]